MDLNPWIYRNRRCTCGALIDYHADACEECALGYVKRWDYDGSGVSVTQLAAKWNLQPGPEDPDRDCVTANGLTHSENRMERRPEPVRGFAVTPSDSIQGKRRQPTDYERRARVYYEEWWIPGLGG